MSTINTLVDAIQESYDVAFGLSDSDQAKYHLICRYRDRVSPRLLKKKIELRESARGAFADHLKILMDLPNPFLEIVKKNSDFSGQYIPVPIQSYSEDTGKR